MKLTVYLSASMLALLALPGSGRAAAPDGSNNPYANLDPDGVPLSVTQGDSGLTPKQVDAKQQAADAERARNWLLLDYEKQVQQHNANTTGQDKTSNVYLDLSLNKDLAHLAGLTPIEAYKPAPATPQYHASTGPTSQGSMALRPSPSPGSGSYSTLVPPLTAPGINSVSQPYTISPLATPLPGELGAGPAFLPGAQRAPAPAPAPDTRSHSPSPIDTIDLQTPGMTAAKDNPLPGTPDLNLDSLPDPNMVGNLPGQNPNALPQLPQVPQAMTADQLHLNLNAKLQVAKPLTAQTGTLTQQQQQTQTPAQPLPPETPMPVSQQPVVTPVHAPIGNPYDILNR